MDYALPIRTINFFKALIRLAFYSLKVLSILIVIIAVSIPSFF